MAIEVYRIFYKLKRVIKFLGLDTNSFLGIVNKITILKYLKTFSNKIILIVLDLKA